MHRALAVTAHPARALARIAILFAALSSAGDASAQVVLDGTLGPSGPITPDAGGEFAITEALGQRSGANLFHSFSRLDVAAGQTAHFSGAPDIERILARVTGPGASSIDGTLRSSIAGADLFLFNPNGILFGPNARVDVGGSFFASAADALALEDGTQYLADAAQAVSLTSAPPSAWGFMRASPAPIVVDRSRLEVGPGEVLSLVGGDLEVVGRSGDVTGGAPSLVAPGGRVDLVAVGGAASVAVDARAIDASLAGLSGGATLRENALVDTSGDGGGTFVLRGGSLVVDASFVYSDNTGSAAPPAQAIDVDVTGDVVVTAGSLVTSQVFGAGQGGDIRIEADGDIRLEGDSDVVSWAYPGSGDGGDVWLGARHVEIVGGSQLTTQTQAAGDAGALTIESDSLTISGTRSLVATATTPASDSPSVIGNGGTLTVDTGALRLERGGQILSRTAGTGRGGDIDVDAETIEIVGISPDPVDGSRPPSGILSIESTGEHHTGPSVGAGGDVRVDATDRIDLEGGGTISSQSLVEGDDPRAGPAPLLEVRAPTIRIDGSADANQSGILARGIDRDASDLTVVAGELEVTNGGLVSASTRGRGDGGTVRIQAERITVEGADEAGIRSGLFSQTLSFLPSAGAGGEMWIFTRDLYVGEGADVSVSSRFKNDAGSLYVNASGEPLSRSDWTKYARIRVDGGRILSSIREISGTTRNGADITIHGERLELTGGGLISALNEDEGNAGNITLDLSQELRSEGGEIRTRAENGLGGNVEIDAPRLVYLYDSIIETSVTGTAGDGGNVTVRSDFVTMNASTIEAKAVIGHGGDILIDAETFAASADSVLDATSGNPELSGNVIIRSLEESLPHPLPRLQDRYLDDADELRRACPTEGAPGGSLTIEGPVLRGDPDAPLVRRGEAGAPGCPAPTGDEP